MLNLIGHLVIVLGLILGSTTDLRTREVPDWLNYALIGTGLGLGMLTSIIESSFHALASSVIGFIAGVIIGYVMYYAGQWGGGDAKLIMGLGAIFGLSLWNNGMPLFIIFVINTIFAGAIYGLGWAAYLVIKHWKRTKEHLSALLHTKKMLMTRKILLGVIVILLIAAFSVKALILKLTLIIVAGASFLTFYLYVISKVIEKTGMLKEVKYEDLTEGDWVARPVWTTAAYRSPIEEIKRQQQTSHAEAKMYDDLLGWQQQLGLTKQAKRRIARLERKHLKTEEQITKEVQRAYKQTHGKDLSRQALHAKTLAEIKRYEKQYERLLSFLEEHYNYKTDKILLASDKGLGLTKEQLRLLKKHDVTSILIKEGIPFVPSFALAYLLTILAGNWLALLI